MENIYGNGVAYVVLGGYKYVEIYSLISDKYHMIVA